MVKIQAVILALTLKAFSTLDPEIEDEELRAANVLIYLNKRQPELKNKVTIATWNHDSNITEETLKEKVCSIND